MYQAQVNAQVGINTDQPGATLDVTAKNSTGVTTRVEGIVIPRVDRQKAQSMTASSIPTSTLIYVNDASTGAQTGTAINIDAVGFYYYNGTVWTKLNSDSIDTSLYVGDGTLSSERTVNLDGNNLKFTGTGNVGIGTSSTPNAKLEVVGGVNFPTVATTNVIGPYSALGINSTTGALGIFTQSSPPIAAVKSAYNSYTAATSTPFELTTLTDIFINTLSITITDDVTNGDYITIPAAGIYRIDTNWSQVSSNVAANGTWLNVLTQPTTGGAITSYDRIYVGGPANTVTQSYNASLVLQTTAATRIYLRSESQNGGLIRRAVFTNPPLYTLSVLITKL